MSLRKLGCFDGLLIEYESYLKDYPNDLFILNHYLNACINLNQLTKIRPYLENIPTSIEKSKKYGLDFQCMTLRYYCFTQQFEKCYELLQKYRKKVSSEKKDSLIDLDFYLRYKLDLLKRKEKKNHNYVFQQIVDYDIEKAIRHIQKHIAHKYPTMTTFTNINHLGDLLESMQQYLPNSDHHNTLFFENKYDFKLTNEDAVNESFKNLFNVFAIDGTASIISMAPNRNAYHAPITQISSNLEFIKEQTPKIKQKSQIEKFNEQYRKK